MAAGRRTRHFDREQVLEVLREAVGIVEELEPPAELREESYRSAVAMVSKVTIELVAPGPLDLSRMR